jgi:hypothetical protein
MEPETRTPRDKGRSVHFLRCLPFVLICNAALLDGTARLGYNCPGENNRNPAHVRTGIIVPARNLYHDGVIRALTADGWTITHDPLTISFGGKDLYVDLGAERETIAAEKDDLRIAV